MTYYLRFLAEQQQIQAQQHSPHMAAELKVKTKAPPIKNIVPIAVIPNPIVTGKNKTTTAAIAQATKNI